MLIRFAERCLESDNELQVQYVAVLPEEHRKKKARRKPEQRRVISIQHLVSRWIDRSSEGGDSIDDDLIS